jgi:hypothetical protein
VNREDDVAEGFSVLERETAGDGTRLQDFRSSFEKTRRTWSTDGGVRRDADIE